MSDNKKDLPHWRRRKNEGGSMFQIEEKYKARGSSHLKHMLFENYNLKYVIYIHTYTYVSD